MDISCFHYSFSHRDLEWLINYMITYLLSIFTFVRPWSFLLNNETCQHSSLGGGADHLPHLSVLSLNTEIFEPQLFLIFQMAP